MVKQGMTFSRLMMHFVLFGFALLCIVPMLAVISISFTDNHSLVHDGFRLIPQQFSLGAYRYALADYEGIIRAYWVTIRVTITGTILALLSTSGIAYAISRVDFKLRKPLSFYVFFTMLFSGGTIPFYMLIVNYLGLFNNIWALILPGLVGAWNVLLLRTFFAKIPMEIIESATIDGANEYTIFFRIVLPLSKPALATIGLFIMLFFWNDSWFALLFMHDNSRIPIQLVLVRVMAVAHFLTTTNNPLLVGMRAPTEALRMALVVLAAGPMMFVFPFFQKYFVKGLTVGAIKG